MPPLMLNAPPPPPPPLQLLVAESGQRQHLVELQFARSLTHHHRVSSSHAGAAAEGGPGAELHVMQVSGHACGGHVQEREGMWGVCAGGGRRGGHICGAQPEAVYVVHMLVVRHSFVHTTCLITSSLGSACATPCLIPALRAGPRPHILA